MIYLMSIILSFNLGVAQSSTPPADPVDVTLQKNPKRERGFRFVSMGFLKKKFGTPGVASEAMNNALDAADQLVLTCDGGSAVACALAGMMANQALIAAEVGASMQNLEGQLSLTDVAYNSSFGEGKAKAQGIMDSLQTKHGYATAADNTVTSATKTYLPGDFGDKKEMMDMGWTEGEYNEAFELLPMKSAPYALVYPDTQVTPAINQPNFSGAPDQVTFQGQNGNVEVGTRQLASSPTDPAPGTFSASQLSTMSQNFNGEPIGVSGGDLFMSASLTYQSLDNKNQFINQEN